MEYSTASNLAGLMGLSTGIVARLLLFRHDGWDLLGKRVFMVYLTLFALLCIVVRSTDHLAWPVGPLRGCILDLRRLSALEIAFSHLAGLYGSIAIYRLFLYRSDESATVRQAAENAGGLERTRMAG